MPRSLADRLSSLPRHPFKLAHALVRSDSRPLIVFAADDAQLREAGRDILELENYRVVTASTSQELVTLCRNKSIDLILVAPSLKDENGQPIIDRLRQIRKCRRVRMVALSVHPSHRDITQLLQQGYYNVLFEPLNGEDLITLVQNALRPS